MFFTFIIQAFIALTCVVNSLVGTSLTVYSPSTFELFVLDMTAVALFLTPAHESSDISQTTAITSVATTESNDTCTWGIPGLLSLRPVALPPSVINVPSRELQLYNASTHALSLLKKDTASCALLGNTTELVFAIHTPKRANAPFTTTMVRLYFTVGKYMLYTYATVILAKIFMSERIQEESDSDESTVSTWSILLFMSLC